MIPHSFWQKRAHVYPWDGVAFWQAGTSLSKV
ncbi:hypothetical protein LINPERPRIM_LOCUS581 [Linum perenne]